MKLTTANIAALKRPADKADHVEWDDALPGFGVRMRGDAKGYLIQFRVNGQQRRVGIGDTRRITLEDARRIARKHFAQAQLGVDPTVERAKARAAAAAATLTFGRLVEDYLQAKQSTLRPSSYSSTRRYLTQHWRALHDLPIGDIKHATVAAQLRILAADHGPVAAARARSTLAALFTGATMEGLYDGANPVAATATPDSHIKPRERVLTLAELATVWRACRDNAFGRVVRLLALTGARRMEIAGLRWGEVDLDAGVITVARTRTKNGHALTLRLAPAAVEILRALPRTYDRVFSAICWSAATADLRLRIMTETGSELKDFRLHDLRRSMATHLAELGTEPHIIEALLNHHGGHRKGVAGIYNRATYEAPKAAALRLWAETLLAAVEKRESKVTVLRRA
jgi:integrase